MKVECVNNKQASPLVIGNIYEVMEQDQMNGEVYYKIWLESFNMFTWFFANRFVEVKENEYKVDLL